MGCPRQHAGRAHSACFRLQLLLLAHTLQAIKTLVPASFSLTTTRCPVNFGLAGNHTFEAGFCQLTGDTSTVSFSMFYSKGGRQQTCAELTRQRRTLAVPAYVSCWLQGLASTSRVAFACLTLHGRPHPPLLPWSSLLQRQRLWQTCPLICGGVAPARYAGSQPCNSRVAPAGLRQPMPCLPPARQCPLPQPRICLAAVAAGLHGWRARPRPHAGGCGRNEAGLGPRLQARQGEGLGPAGERRQPLLQERPSGWQLVTPPPSVPCPCSPCWPASTAGPPHPSSWRSKPTAAAPAQSCFRGGLRWAAWHLAGRFPLEANWLPSHVHAAPTHNHHHQPALMLNALQHSSCVLYSWHCLLETCLHTNALQNTWAGFMPA